MDIKVQGQEEKPIVMEEATETPVIEGELLGNYEINEVGNMFDLKPSEISQFEDKLTLLIEFAKTQTDDHTVEGIKWAIRSLQGKVGTPPLGEKMINYLQKYAYLKMEAKRLEKDIEKYEHN